jgi:hypothetical protein
VTFRSLLEGETTQDMMEVEIYRVKKGAERYDNVPSGTAYFKDVDGNEHSCPAYYDTQATRSIASEGLAKSFEIELKRVPEDKTEFCTTVLDQGAKFEPRYLITPVIKCSKGLKEWEPEYLYVVPSSEVFIIFSWDYMRRNRIMNTIVDDMTRMMASEDPGMFEDSTTTPTSAPYVNQARFRRSELGKYKNQFQLQPVQANMR